MCPTLPAAFSREGSRRRILVFHAVSLHSKIRLRRAATIPCAITKTGPRKDISGLPPKRSILDGSCAAFGPGHARHAPVSMPITWPQVKQGLDPMQYTLHTAPQLLKQSKAWLDYCDAERPLLEFYSQTRKANGARQGGLRATRPGEFEIAGGRLIWPMPLHSAVILRTIPHKVCFSPFAYSSQEPRRSTIPAPAHPKLVLWCRLRDVPQLRPSDRRRISRP